MLVNPVDQLRVAASAHAKWICDKEGLEQETQDVLANHEGPAVRARMLASVFATRDTLSKANEKIRAADEAGNRDEFTLERAVLSVNFMTPAVILAELTTYPEDGDDINRIWAAQCARGTLGQQEKEDRNSSGRSWPDAIAKYQRGRGNYGYRACETPHDDLVFRFEQEAEAAALSAAG